MCVSEYLCEVLECFLSCWVVSFFIFGWGCVVCAEGGEEEECEEFFHGVVCFGLGWTNLGVFLFFPRVWGLFV